MKHIKIVSVTAAGYRLACTVKQGLDGYLTEVYGRGSDDSLYGTDFSRMVQQSMYDCDGIVFICAAGIAVRMCAPYIRGKAQDPAVVVMDERGQFAIALLSGHLGGANALAHEVARAVGAQPVITTATDLNGVFAVDTWAESRGYHVLEPGNIRFVSAALLAGETVGFISEHPVLGSLPTGVVHGAAARTGFVVSSSAADAPFPHTLHLVPKSVIIGIGCRRGVSALALEQAVLEHLAQTGISIKAVQAVATIDIKKYEGAILQLCAKYSLTLYTYSAAQLREAKGEFTASSFVEETVGADNVCERAAVLASGGVLRARKRAQNGVTTALAERQVEVQF